MGSPYRVLVAAFRVSICLLVWQGAQTWPCLACALASASRVRRRCSQLVLVCPLSLQFLSFHGSRTLFLFIGSPQLFCPVFEPCQVFSAARQDFVVILACRPGLSCTSKSPCNRPYVTEGT